MRYIEPVRAKVLMMMFFATGTVGVVIALSPIAPGSVKMIITLMGVVNIGLGAFFTFILMTQPKKEPDKRKKKKKNKE